jgi:hypothetical protein
MKKAFEVRIRRYDRREGLSNWQTLKLDATSAATAIARAVRAYQKTQTRKERRDTDKSLEVKCTYLQPAYKLLALSVFFSLFLLAACGSGPNSGGTLGNPSPEPAAIQGAWEIVAVSTANPTAGYPDTLIEANLMQTDTNVFAGSQSVTVEAFKADGTANYSYADPSINACGGSSGQAIGAQISNGTSLSFTLTLSGPGGTLTLLGTAAISPDGKSMSGSYSSAAACGLPADEGTLSGALVPSFAGTYAVDVYEGSPRSIAISEDARFDVQISGTDQGESFILAGDAVGGSFSVSAPESNSGYFGVYLTPQLVTLIPSIQSNGSQIATKSGDLLMITTVSGGLAPTGNSLAVPN